MHIDPIRYVRVLSTICVCAVVILAASGCVTVKRYLDADKKKPTVLFRGHELVLYLTTKEGKIYDKKYKDTFNIMVDIRFVDSDLDKHPNWEKIIVDIDSLCIDFVGTKETICPPEIEPLMSENWLLGNKLRGPMYAWQGIEIPVERSSIVVSYRAVLLDRLNREEYEHQWFLDTLQRVHNKRLEVLR